VSDVRTPVPAYNMQYPYQLCYAHGDDHLHILLKLYNICFFLKKSKWDILTMAMKLSSTSCTKKPPQKTNRLTEYLQDNNVSQDPDKVKGLTTISENRAQT